MSLSKSDHAAIKRALDNKRSPQYQEAYQNVAREIKMMADGGMTLPQIIEALTQGKQQA